MESRRCTSDPMSCSPLRRTRCRWPGSRRPAASFHWRHACPRSRSCRVTGDGLRGRFPWPSASSPRPRGAVPPATTSQRTTSARGLRLAVGTPAKILDSTGAAQDASSHPLTRQEILQLIAEEHTSAEIGKILFISEKTVEKHRTKLMEKLNVRNLAGLVRLAVKYHLVDRDA